MRSTSQIYFLIILCVFLIMQYFVRVNYIKHEIIRPSFRKTDVDVPLLYIITPTYRRPEQIPELVRLSHTLMLVPHLVWLVIEDGLSKNELVENVLYKFGSNYHYLLAPMPEKYMKNNVKPKGVSNRNKGLEWIRQNAKSGVFYFADDDNTYDTELFDEIRKTKTVSLFPVGLVTEAGLSTPIVKNCTLVGFYDGWIGNRKFPVDMAGFAVSVEFLLTRPNALMPYTPGYEETGFLRSLAPFEANEAQLLASCCTKILVWHTKTIRNKPAKLLNIAVSLNDSNISVLRNFMV